MRMVGGNGELFLSRLDRGRFALEEAPAAEGLGIGRAEVAKASQRDRERD